MKRMNTMNNINQEMEEVDESFKNNVWSTQLQHKEIVITGTIKEDLIERAVIQLFNFNNMDNQQRLEIEERQPIIIYINTFGGSLNESFSLIEAIEHSTTPVITVALGKACSSGFLILLAGHKRYAQKYTTLMYHQGSGGVLAEFGKIIEYGKYIEAMQKDIDDYVISKTNIKKKKMDDVFHHKQDWFICTEEAINLGIIDGVWTGV